MCHTPQSQGLIGKVESEFEYNRAKLLESMGAEVRNVISSYDKTEEARQLANEVRLPPSTSATAVRDVRSACMHCEC
jgi:predicted Mrr-cat superfamily restriction endonuclease